MDRSQVGGVIGDLLRELAATGVDICSNRKADGVHGGVCF